MQATALEWKQGERTLLQQPRLLFPSGQVTLVETVRSSGFALVDREVDRFRLERKP
jgi:hypothetical protein